MPRTIPLISPRHLRRYREIVEVLAGHGFGVLLDQLDLSQRLNLPYRLLSRWQAPPEVNTAEHVRLALEELGPTAIKLGQLLSTRPDLLPPDIIVELRRLQDAAPEVAWPGIRARIEEELGAPMGEVFAEWDEAPLAAASLAQVHAATLLDGRPVVIKVQRPGIQANIDLDLDILYDLARLAQQRTPLGDIYELEDVAVEFAATLQGELDYRREGRNADRFRANFADEPDLVAPHVVWEYTTRRVLVMERIHGVKIDDVAALAAAGYDRRRVAHKCARMIVKEVLEDGFFHADPHPGNFFVLPGERIGVMDFGKVGTLEAVDRDNLLRLYVRLVQQDMEGIVNQMIRMGVASRRVNRDALQRDVRRLLTKYVGASLEEITFREVFEDTMPVIFRHHLRFPTNLWLLSQTLGVMEGLALKLDPDFDVFEVSKPFVTRFAREIWLPSHWGPTALRGVTDWVDLVRLAPRQMGRILDQAEHGEFSLRVDIPELRETTNQLNRIANRLTLAIVVAAFILALAWLIPSLNLTWPWSWYNWLMVLAFLVSSMLGLWLLWHILRSGR
jgi:ubiquinone biosynthesis protein